MNTQPGLKIGPVEINRFHLIRLIYVIGVISVGYGLYTASGLLDVDKRAADLIVEIDAKTAEARARLETVQAEATAILDKAHREAEQIRAAAEADATAKKKAVRQAAMAANKNLIDTGEQLGRLIVEARTAYEQILRQGIQDAGDPAEIRKWENLLANYRRRFADAPLKQWQEKFDAVQKQIETQPADE